jgi:hypothetical protein
MMAVLLRLMGNSKRRIAMSSQHNKHQHTQDDRYTSQNPEHAANDPVREPNPNPGPANPGENPSGDPGRPPAEVPVQTPNEVPDMTPRS